jgi:hypothetical protein
MNLTILMRHENEYRHATVSFTRMFAPRNQLPDFLKIVFCLFVFEKIQFLHTAVVVRLLADLVSFFEI